MKQYLMEMEEYALEKNVPIIEKASIAFIMKYIRNNEIHNVLEIGSAIGYSAILMASCRPDVTVTTIERDETRYMEALKNIKNCGLDKKINVVYQDALEVNLSEEIKYDLIFIDAAKSQNIKYFEKFKFFLNANGTIITDNINFHGYVGNSKNIDNSNLKSMVSKIEEYITFLNENKEFNTKFYDIGDGLAVSIRNNNEK